MRSSEKTDKNDYPHEAADSTDLVVHHTVFYIYITGTPTSEPPAAIFLSVMGRNSATNRREKSKLSSGKGPKQSHHKADLKKSKKDDSGSDPHSNEEEVDNISDSESAKGFVGSVDIPNQDKLLIPIDSPWYEIDLDLAKGDENNKNFSLSQSEINRLYERGKRALEQDNETYHVEFTKVSNQAKFLSRILTGGTLNDKISALTLLVQESPIHNMKSLDTLFSYCNKKSRNSQLQSLNALKDLFLNGILPDRKLRYFQNQPYLSSSLSDKALAVFYFEDYLKNLFFKILEVFEKLSHDPIIHVRSSVLTHIFDLITAKPEQEFNLLRLGVNKLGDLDSKVASKASYLLLKLEQSHPNMTGVIIDSVVDMALRPSTDYRATYYSVITLNQTILRRSDQEVANKLVNTYLTLFKKYLVNSDEEHGDVKLKPTHKRFDEKRNKVVKRGKKGGKSVKETKSESEILSERNSKLFSAILTGLNRAFPFSQLPDSVYEAQLDTLFKIAHSVNFGTSVQALVLINQVTTKAKLNNDRYYRTLYESLLDPRLVSSSKQGIYLNLLYKSLKQDAQNVERVEAFVKRILQVSTHWLNIGTVAGFFYLLLQLVKVVPQIRNLLINSPVDESYSTNESQGEVAAEKKRYDGQKRDPRYANADKSAIWEIEQFLNHFHPTVQTYAEAFASGKRGNIVKPDLGLFTLAHFLDRFVYRNAKQKHVSRGTSIMQPLFGGASTKDSYLVKASDLILDQTPANAENWLEKKVEDIKPEDRFFYQYFSTKRNAMKQGKAGGNGDESEDEMDEEDIWSALVKSRPDVEGDENDDVDFGEEDFMSMDSESDLDSDNGDSSTADSEDENEDHTDSANSHDEEDFGEDVEAEFAGFSESDSESDQGGERSSRKRTVDEDSSEPKSENESSLAKKKRKSNKQKLKDLPLFASADEYAEYMQSDDE